MKTTTLPSLRVDPHLRNTAQSVRAEFMARGLASREAAQTTGVYYSADGVHVELSQMLEQTCARVQKQKPERDRPSGR